MIKELAIIAGLLSPVSPDMQRSFDALVVDFATCHAYYGYKEAYFSIGDAAERIKALGAQASAAYEGRRLETLAGLPSGTFYQRQAAISQDMKKTLDSPGFSGLYSVYEGFCEDLRENTGKHYLRHLRKPIKPMKTSDSV